MQPVPTGTKAGYRAVVLILLLVAASLRLVYAHGLPMNFDEVDHWNLALTVSLRPGAFHFPLGSPRTNHPLLCVYLIALGQWLGHGSVFFVRVVFVALSLGGLVGVCVLTKRLFGAKPALVALALAVVDRHLVTSAAVFLEPTYLNLMPWTLLVIYRLLAGGAPSLGLWVALGILVGTGYQFSEIYLLVLPPLALCMVWGMGARRALLQWGPWLAVGLFLLLIAPSLIWNVLHHGQNFDRTVTKVNGIGLSPRCLLLLLGDVLICLKNPTWIVMEWHHAMYVPTTIPCFWIAGVVYLTCGLAALRHARQLEYTFLLLFIACAVLPISLLDRHEPWNEIGWASMILLALLPLTAVMLTAAVPRRVGPVLAAVLGIVFTGHLAVFLGEPKWGYPTPCDEVRFVGSAYAPHDRQGNLDPAVGARRTEAFLREHPRSAIGYYYQAFFTRDPQQWRRSLDMALRIEPDNPAVRLMQAKAYGRAGRYAKAEELLQQALAAGDDCFALHAQLAETTLFLKDNTLAEKHALEALYRKPDEYPMYVILYCVRQERGDVDGAKAALDRFVTMGFDRPEEGFAATARLLLRLDQPRQAAELLDRALKLAPDREDIWKLRKQADNMSPHASSPAPAGN